MLFRSKQAKQEGARIVDITREELAAFSQLREVMKEKGLGHISDNIESLMDGDAKTRVERGAKLRETVAANMEVLRTGGFGRFDLRRYLSEGKWWVVTSVAGRKVKRLYGIESAVDEFMKHNRRKFGQNSPDADTQHSLILNIFFETDKSFLKNGGIDYSYQNHEGSGNQLKRIKRV